MSLGHQWGINEVNTHFLSGLVLLYCVQFTRFLANLLLLSRPRHLYFPLSAIINPVKARVFKEFIKVKIKIYSVQYCVLAYLINQAHK